jgi:hypothetical protein
MERFVCRMFPLQRFRFFPQRKHLKNPTEKIIIYPHLFHWPRYQSKLVVLLSLRFKILTAPFTPMSIFPRIVWLVAMNRLDEILGLMTMFSW